MFAADDAFFTTILRLLRSLPAYAVFGDGRTRVQPVYVDDVAAVIAQILRQNQKPYPVYELPGPRVYSYEELLRTIARIAGLRPVLMRIPFAFWDALAGVAEMLPRPPLTRNQVELMQLDTTASESLPGFRALGISPRSLEEELEAILRQNKPKSIITVTAPIVLPWPLWSGLEVATRVLFDLGDESSTAARGHRTRPTIRPAGWPMSDFTGAMIRLCNRNGDICQNVVTTEGTAHYPRNGDSSTGPSNSPAIRPRAVAARASLQPARRTLSRNFSSRSARVSGACAPPRIKGWCSSITAPSRSVARIWPVKFFG
jgi:hypothetical protein